MNHATQPDSTFWDKLADRYAEKPVDNPAAFERKIAITQSLMTSESTVLDVGCGTGSLALILAANAEHVHGLDLSPAMMRIANRKAAGQGVDNVTFHTGTLDQVSAFTPGSLDGICLYSLLHLLHDRQSMLERVYSLLKPGGFFVSSTVCLGEEWMPYSLVLPVMKVLGKAPYVAVISRDTVKREVAAAGFIDVSTPDVGAKRATLFLVCFKPAA